VDGGELAEGMAQGARRTETVTMIAMGLAYGVLIGAMVMLTFYMWIWSK
jgi:hypothetical protein